MKKKTHVQRRITGVLLIAAIPFLFLFILLLLPLALGNEKEESER
jgi:hypothetical protein